MAAFSRLDGDAVASIAGLRPARLSPNLRAGLGPEYFSNLLTDGLGEPIDRLAECSFESSLPGFALWKQDGS